MPKSDVKFFVWFSLKIFKINLILCMIILNDSFYSFNTTSRIDFILLMWQSGKNLDEIDIILFQIYNLEFSFVNFLDIQKRFFLNDRVFLLIKSLANNGQNYSPSVFQIWWMIVNKIGETSNNVFFYTEQFCWAENLL